MVPSLFKSDGHLKTVLEFGFMSNRDVKCYVEKEYRTYNQKYRIECFSFHVFV